MFVLSSTFYMEYVVVLHLQRRTGLSLLMLQKGVASLLGLTYTDHAGDYMFILTNDICDSSYGLTK